jgi:hypothetical protein
MPEINTDIEAFIKERVNLARGGYPPHEVVQLMRLAFSLGDLHGNKHALEVLENKIQQVHGLVCGK